MTRRHACRRETDVLDLVAIGQWPSRADAALREHVSGCEICADLAAVAAAMSHLGDAALASVRVPDAAAVWYRAQLAAREDLARRAARPMVAAEIAAVAGMIGAGVVAWQIGGPWVTEWWTSSGRSAFALPSVDLSTWNLSAVAGWRWVAAGFAAWAALIPAAFYLARVADRSIDAPVDRRNQA